MICFKCVECGKKRSLASIKGNVWKCRYCSVRQCRSAEYITIYNAVVNYDHDRVLFLAKASNGLTHIGTSKHLDKTIIALCKASPIHIKLLHTIKPSNMFSALDMFEYLELILSKWRKHHQWYHLPDKALHGLCNLDGTNFERLIAVWNKE